ncbi:hypothetical protein QQG55_8605 [Brugia pahangi]
MFFTIPMTPIIWLNLLLCIISEKNKTFPIINLDKSDEIITYTTHSGTSNSFDILDYNNFEPLFGSEFPSDPSQLIDFDQLSEIEDISSKESIPEITNAPHPGFSNSHGLLGHTNLDSLLGSYTDSNRNVWRDANGELKTNDDEARYPIIRDIQSGTSSPLNVDTDDIITYMHLPGSQQNAVPIYFHQLTLSPDDTSDQHGNAEQNNMGNKHFSDKLIVPDYRENEGSETNTQSGTSSPLNVDTDDIITYMHLPGSQQNAVPIYFHQLTLSPDDTSDQHGNAEQNNMGNKHFSDKENTNEGSETDKKKYICHYPGCTVITKNYNEYITHRKTHQPFIYECRVTNCGRTFHHESSFRNHKQTHEPHPQCEGCGKFFINRNGLHCHKKSCKSKSRERSYECLYPGCTMITKNYNEYITHRKTHQPFIYECRVTNCGRTFHHESSFRSHKQAHEPHPQCECCGKFFCRMDVLKSHKKVCSRVPR